MTTTPDDRSLPPPMRRWLGFTIALVLLSVLGVVINAIVGFTVAIGKAVCGNNDDGFVCSTQGEQLAIWFPWGGWVAAIVLSLILARRAVRDGRSPWSSLGAGGAVYAVSFLIAYSIAVS